MRNPNPDQACANTDREIWREREGDYYADSIHVTKQDGIGINCGGFVYVKPVREWHKLAGGIKSMLPHDSSPSETDTPQDQRASADTAVVAEEALAGTDRRGIQSEAHPSQPAPPALGTPRTDALTSKWTGDLIARKNWHELREHARTLERELDTQIIVADFLGETTKAQHDKIIDLQRELSAATERLNAPVPDVADMCRRFDEADRGRQTNISHVRPFSLLGEAADKLRDLGRRLAEANVLRQNYDERIAFFEKKLDAAYTVAAEAVAKERPPYTPEHLLYVAENTLIPVDQKKRSALMELTYWLGKPDGYVAPRPISDPAATAAIRGSSEGGST